jgi:hypothetical protein
LEKNGFAWKDAGKIKYPGGLDKEEKELLMEMAKHYARIEGAK